MPIVCVSSVRFSERMKTMATRRHIHVLIFSMFVFFGKLYFVLRLFVLLFIHLCVCVCVCIIP